MAASRFQQVRVTGFTIWVTVESRRRHRTYEVYAMYDPEADHWTGYDPYHGLTLSSFTHHVHQAFRNAGSTEPEIAALPARASISRLLPR